MTVAHLSALVAHYGYVATFVAVLVASAGAPIPAGELLIAAAVYAAHTHRLAIVGLILVGSAGGILGGIIGYGIGASLAAATLERFGGKVGLTPARIRLGRYLFAVHGGKIVFFVRFVALLGPFGGVLAGTNRMPMGRFMAFNALSAVAWTALFAAIGYLFGAMFETVGRTAGIAAVVLTIAAVLLLLRWIHQREAVLQARADEMLCGAAPTGD
jgi:membrane protein DedA with SNARE-associated domain